MSVGLGLGFRVQGSAYSNFHRNILHLRVQRFVILRSASAFMTTHPFGRAVATSNPREVSLNCYNEHGDISVQPPVTPAEPWCFRSQAFWHFPPTGNLNPPIPSSFAEYTSEFNHSHIQGSACGGQSTREAYITPTRSTRSLTTWSKLSSTPRTGLIHTCQKTTTYSRFSPNVLGRMISRD